MDDQGSIGRADLQGCRSPRAGVLGDDYRLERATADVIEEGRIIGEDELKVLLDLAQASQLRAQPLQLPGQPLGGRGANTPDEQSTGRHREGQDRDQEREGDLQRHLEGSVPPARDEGGPLSPAQGWEPPLRAGVGHPGRPSNLGLVTGDRRRRSAI